MIQKIKTAEIILKIFTRGHYREFRLPEWFNGPEELTKILQEVWNRSYPDLHDRGGKDDLEEAIGELLKTLGTLNNEMTHKRYVYIAWTMALAAEATIKHYFPDNQIFSLVEKQVLLWLEKGVEVPDNFANTVFSDLEKIGKYQAAGEAYNILYATLNSLEVENADEAVLDILDDVLTGDPVSGSTDTKRDIFNWFIVEVIPAAYCLRIPDTIYSGKWKFPPLIEYYSENPILVS